MLSFSAATWLNLVAIPLTYLAISGAAVKRISDLSQPGCVKELHHFLLIRRFDTCRKRLCKESQDVSEPDPPRPTSSLATESDLLFYNASEAASSLNMYLAEVGETPYSQNKAYSKSYSRQKVKKITEALQRTVITGAPIDDGTDMIEQLKEKFQETNKRSERVQVHTVLPKSWSVKKMQQEFGDSEYLA